MSDPINSEKKLQRCEEQISDKDKASYNVSQDRVCVIITQKKNSSWVDDLDARERLNKCQRVFH